MAGAERRRLWGQPPPGGVAALSPPGRVSVRRGDVPGGGPERPPGPARLPLAVRAVRGPGRAGGIGNAVHREGIQEFVLRGGQRWRRAAAGKAGWRRRAGGCAVRRQGPAEGSGGHSCISLVRVGVSTLGSLAARYAFPFLESYLNLRACQAGGSPSAGLRCVRQRGAGPALGFSGRRLLPAPAEAAVNHCSASICSVAVINGGVFGTHPKSLPMPSF